MSQGQPFPAAVARVAARSLLGALETACERIEIAGSLRRGKSEVHDIELVATARLEERPDGLFGSEQADLLEERVAALLAPGRFRAFIEARQVETHRADGTVEYRTKLGPAYKALAHRGIPVDLFIVRPPAAWGCIFALRTGPGTWNTRLVTECKSIGRRVEGGQVQRWTGAGWDPVPTPEEEDFFRALGQPWVEPRDRRVELVRIDRATADVVLA